MKPIVLLGFEQSTVTNTIANTIRQLDKNVTIENPTQFLQHGGTSTVEYIVTVSLDLDLRQQVIEKLDQDQLARATFVHPTAVIDDTAEILSGTWIGPFSSLFYQSKVGKDCIVAPYGMVGHRSQIGDSCLMHPGAMIAGSTKIGNQCILGLRSTVIDKINICNNVYIGAGSMITKSINEPGKFIGNPARRVQ